jgi:DNA-binding beta-propeller fold protein YncE
VALAAVTLATVTVATPPAGARIGVGQPAGCVLQARERPSACGRGFGLLGAAGVAISPDGSTLYAAARDSYSVATLPREGATGALRWTGCISDDGADGTFGSDGRCRDGDVLRGPSDVDVSADGRNVYVTNPRSAAIATFARDPATGALSPIGCLANALADGRCSDASAMRAPRQLVLSPDGRFAYVAADSSNAVDVLARDAETGVLHPQSCVSDNGTDGICADGVALRGASGLAMSPDGANLCVAARTSGALAVFARDPASGRLRQTGCLLHAAPPGVCTPAYPVRGVSAIAVSADGGTVIAAGSAGVAAFVRDGTTGALHLTGCLGGGGCPPLTTMDHPSAVLVAPDGSRALLADRGTGTVTEIADVGGRLTELSCLRGRASYGPGDCTGRSALDDVAGLVASPDGRFVYAAAGAGVLRLPVGGPW